MDHHPLGVNCHVTIGRLGSLSEMAMDHHPLGVNCHVTIGRRLRRGRDGIRADTGARNHENPAALRNVFGLGIIPRT